MREVMRSAAWHASVRLGWALLILGLSSLSSCNCGNGGGELAIPCASDSECPAPMICDEGKGECTTPRGDGGLGPTTCSPPSLGCACKSNSRPIACRAEGEDPNVLADCLVGESICQNGTYGECKVTANPRCESVGVDPGSFKPTPENSDQVKVGPEGELILDPGKEQVVFGYLWVANSAENTVSKVDVETGREVARYASVRDTTALGVPAVPIGGYPGGPTNETCGNCPSRTAIDRNGDAFVANRAFGMQATVTKYANDTKNCIDVNRNNQTETSRDANNDGRIDIDDPSEFFGEADECILWTKPVGRPGGIARALAIDAGGPEGEDGNVWVGLYREHRMVLISGETGEPVLSGAGQPISVSLVDGIGRLAPYGAAVDGGGNVWVTGLDDGELTYLARIHALTAQLVEFHAIPDDKDSCSLGYGISIDVSGRIWLGGWQCKDVKGFDPASKSWYRVDRNNESSTRGVAVDLAGNVWVAYTNRRVGKYKIADVIDKGDGAIGTMYDLPPLQAPTSPVVQGSVNVTIGVGIDRNGACWAVSRNDSLEAGAATRIKPDGTMESFPVGRGPYTYSDFTGFGLSTVVRPNGYFRGIIGGCSKPDAKSKWRTLTWSETEPQGTKVKLRVRVADSIAALASARWYGPWDDSPVDLAAAGVPDAKFMQVEVQFSTTDGKISPSFSGFNVKFSCPGNGVE
ncbi:MAG: hypothetical protein HY698_18115 [Deltaproteobacteria bacterium]|nr:hypothetical protein [Deltaproteobacteria bacterium]